MTVEDVDGVVMVADRPTNDKGSMRTYSSCARISCGLSWAIEVPNFKAGHSGKRSIDQIPI